MTCKMKIYLKNQRMSSLSQNIHIPLTFPITNTFRPPNKIYSIFEKCQEIYIDYLEKLCKLAFNDDSLHLVVREIILYFLIHNKDRFGKYMEEGFNIVQYITRILKVGECGDYEVIVAFSEFYNVQI